MSLAVQSQTKGISQMKSGSDDKADVQERHLFVMLAKINDDMMAIRNNLASNPAVVAATRDFDIRRYQRSMIDEEVHCFEASVEAKTHTGEIFCWSLDITLMSHGWKFQRSIGKFQSKVGGQTSDGEQQENGFEEFTFADFDSLASNYVTLMIEFAASAKNFELR
jgi:hypothetical protein